MSATRRASTCPSPPSSPPRSRARSPMISSAYVEATSPPRCPPIPSATAYSGSSSRYASSLRSRARPTSVHAAARILTLAASSSKLQDRPPDPHPVPGAHRDGLGHPLLVEEGSVRRTKIFHEPLPVPCEQPSMKRGSVRVVQSDLTRFGPPDLH